MSAGKAPKGARQAAPASGGDRISALPDELLHRILAFLPAQQTVRTCVLGRRWQRLWKSSAVLRIVGADGNAPLPFEQARDFVDSLLLLRGSLPLETFELTVGGAAIDVRRVMLWVSYAVQCKVQVLQLSFRGNKHGLHSLRPQDPPLASIHLTKLELRGVAFNGDLLDLSRCPTLKDLEIVCCSFVLAGRISSQSLKRVQIKGSIFNRSSRTHIHAPNLTELELQIISGKTPVLESMPLLILAAVLIWGKSADCCSHSNYGDCGDENCENCIPNDTSSVILHGLSQAKNLELGASTNTMRETNVTLKGKFSPKELPPTISAQLKRVEVRCGAVDEKVVQVLKFLSELNIRQQHIVLLADQLCAVKRICQYVGFC